ncbi:MAG TPA: hypothetical protein VGB35_01635 [Gammaproteobacteria bacterium]|jgi:hypothetical protein
MARAGEILQRLVQTGLKTTLGKNALGNSTGQSQQPYPYLRKLHLLTPTVLATARYDSLTTHRRCHIQINKTMTAITIFVGYYPAKSLKVV